MAELQAAISRTDATRDSSVECINFEMDEALLTGESLPVVKEAAVVTRKNRTTTATRGRAKGYVYATGMNTEIGHIARSLKGKTSQSRRPIPKESGKVTVGAYVRAASGTIKDTVIRFLGLNVGTPLQRKLSKLALILFAIAVLFAIIVLAANKFSNNSEVIIYAVATALSMIPASLVVVLTITMSMGTKRMVKRNVIVRNMNASENLGAVTNICSDKTGTITQGKIVAKRAYIPAYGTFTVDDIRNSNYPSDGSTTFSSLSPVEADTRMHDDNGAEPTKVSNVTTHTHVPAFESFLRVASLCNLAAVHKGFNGQRAAR